MGRFDRIFQHRRSLKMITTGVAVLLLLGTLTGGAWALGVLKGKSVEAAATYYVTDQADGAATVVRWPSVGQVGLQSECSAYLDTTLNQYHVGKIALQVMNKGRDPVGLAADEFPDGFVWLQPGLGDVIGAGEAVNEDTPDGRAGMFSFAILNDRGASVTGLLAWSARLDAADHTGRCVFTLQMKG